MPILSTVVLTNKGEARKANLTLPDGILTLEILQKYNKKKDAPECVAEYEYHNKNISLFGYTKGKKGTENKTEWIEPYSSLKLYGEVIVIQSLDEWSDPIPMTVDQWNYFYQDSQVDEELDKELKEDKDEDKDEDKYDKDEDKDEDKDDKDEDKDEEKDDKDEDKDEDEDGDEKDIKELLIEELEEEEKEEKEKIPIIKKKKPIIYKLDPNVWKEELTLDAQPETEVLRMICISNLSFIEEYFPGESRLLENAIYEASYQHAKKQYIPVHWKVPTYKEIYRQIARSVICNLHPQSPVKNNRLLKRVQDGEFTLCSIPFMSSYELFPENWFVLKDKLLQREQKILEGNKSRATDQFKCRRCQKKECTYYELQTRSADEPMTIFITCLNCGKEWRQGG
jgi:DNA-directed RNA polymerase subunit M/transcription elongation factor TFIIS